LWRGWEGNTSQHPPWHLRPRGGPPRQQRRGPLGPVVGASAHNQQTSVSEPDICTSRYIRDMEKVQTAPVAAAMGGGAGAAGAVDRHHLRQLQPPLQQLPIPQLQSCIRRTAKGGGRPPHHTARSTCQFGSVRGFHPHRMRLREGEVVRRGLTGDRSCSLRLPSLNGHGQSNAT
jgi:hypothetical protein